MNTNDNSQSISPPDFNPGHSGNIRVNDQLVVVNDHTPTGRQVLAAAALRPEDEYVLLYWPDRGPTQEVGLDEVIELPQHGGIAQFLAMRADGIRYFVLDDERYAWAGPLTVEEVRRVGRVAADQDIWLQRQDEADLELGPGTQIDLAGQGVERLYTKAHPHTWRLDVQGDATEWDRPLVGVREAMQRVGLDVSQAWIIVLLREHQPPKPMEMGDTIDLRESGIERLWCKPRDVNNGDGSARRQFRLLPKDEVFLDQKGASWETVTAGERWLIIDRYPQFFNRVRIVVGRPGWSVGVSLRGSASVRLPYDLG